MRRRPGFAGAEGREGSVAGADLAAGPGAQEQVDGVFEAHGFAEEVVGLLVHKRVPAKHWVCVRKDGRRLLYMDSLYADPQEMDEDEVAELVAGRKVFQVVVPRVMQVAG